MTVFLDFSTIGLGNNLFTLAAGLEFAKQYSTDLKVLPTVSKGFRNNLELNLLSVAAISDVIDHLGVGQVGVSDSLEVRERVINGAIGIISESCPYCYTIPKIESRNDVYISGYFQNQDYLGPSLQTLLRTLVKLTDHVRTKNDLSVQIRRGDYKSPEIKRRLGLLSPLHFSSWISKFPESTIVSVHSDDPKSEIDSFLGGQFPYHFVEPQANILETLRLLSNSTHLIISNSTFAWWAGALGEYLGVTQNIISPTRWNRTMECSELLSKSSWIRAQPKWL